MVGASVWLGRLDVWDVVLLYASVLASAVLTTLAWTRTRSSDERTQRSRRLAFWLTSPSVALAITGTLCWTLFIPILRTEVLYQYAVSVHERQWMSWSNAVFAHFLLLPVAALLTLVSLLVPTRGQLLLFLGHRVAALWASWVVLGSMLINIDV